LEKTSGENKMTRYCINSFCVLFISALLLSACSPAPEVPVQYDPSEVRFSGERAFEIEEQFVTTHINRVSGTEASRQATEWLHEQLTAFGWTCEFDEWTIINYSRPVPLSNVICRLEGESPQEILVTAHHDIAPTTIQGADNDGSGIAVLLHLAEIFAAEGMPRYTLVFLISDAEEIGNIGTRRYIDTHPNTDDIVAGISIDNLGRYYYDSMITELVSQFSSYGPIWIGIASRDAAEAAGAEWPVINRGLVDQVLNQAVPIAFTDQGPMIRASVSAIGFGAGYPPEFGNEHYRLWHDPDDSFDKQTPVSLEQSGIISEALIRQILAMDSFPEQFGPYLYFEGSKQLLRGIPLYLIFIGLVSLFFVGSYFTSRGILAEKGVQWLGALPHYLGLWLPLVASILLLYIFVEVGLLDEYAVWPGVTKDPYVLTPRWPAVILFLVGMVLFFYVGRWLVRRFTGDSPAPEFGHIKSLAFLVIGLTGTYVLVVNPFSLLFFVPVLFWFLIGGRKGLGKILDIVFLLLGMLMLFALIYFFGFLTLRYGFTFLWYFLNIISVQMFSFLAVLAGVTVIAAGLSMVVNPPRKS
jgi:hypothetical protein